MRRPDTDPTARPPMVSRANGRPLLAAYTCPPMDSLLVDLKIEVSNLVSLIGRDNGYTEVVSKLLLVSPVFVLLR